MALLETLLRIREQGAVEAEWIVGHVNHQLRGQAADADQRFVERYARQRGLEVISRSVDVPAYARDRKVSIETAGRMLRIGALAAMARQCGAGAVATAHHRDDLAETMIFRLRRGTAFRGLCGIEPVSWLEGIPFIRPLLGISRREILAYCRERNLPWQEDATNADCGYARNRIRHRLLPSLQKRMHTDAVAGLADLAEKSQRLFKRIDEQMNGRMPEIVVRRERGLIALDQSVLTSCGPVELGEIFRRCLVDLDIGLRDYTALHYQQMIRCVYQGGCMKRRLPGEVQFAVEAQALIFRTRSACETLFPDEPVSLEIGSTCRFGPTQISAALIEADADSFEQFQTKKDSRTEWLDADKINGPIRIRRRRPGDRFCPLGMRADKKVGKFLTSAKADSEAKKKIFIIEDSEKILWVAPVRISEQVKVDGHSHRVLQLSIK